ncbi:MAG: AbgT family transporter [Wenzhouxiangella sp.]|jgi:aminobenzoyl-glutamate transport protein|nr:AbgT family transporter [Wenzhouxiangella sp.]
MNQPDNHSFGQRFGAFVERAGRRIPDPVIIFMAFYPLAFLATVILGGHQFESMGAGGEAVTYEILPMWHAEHVRWIFDNALLRNWLAFGNGVLGVILVVMLAIGIAENSGLFGALIKRAGAWIPQSLLPMLLMFLGIMSSIATDAGYLVLIPLAGLLYAGLGRNPLIGMAAAFAGVSAGFSANLIPGTPIDVIIGMNAQVFADAQGVPFTTADGSPLRPATMNYWFILTSTFVLTATGYFVTRRFVEPRLEGQDFVVPDDLDTGEFQVSAAEQRGLRFSLLGVLVAGLMIAGLIFGPLASFENEAGQVVDPYMDNIILLISLFFVVVGVFYGVAAGTFHSVMDVVRAMVKQMNTMGYILVLTFFSYNFLGLLSYSGLGSWITYLGAQSLLALGLQQFPVLLLVGFVLTTAVINIFIGGLTSKWMLLGPIFIPMLYFVNPAMTPDLVAAAFRVADSSTNIITPMMTYAGVILAFMRKYRPDMGFGDMLLIMLPYSIAFTLVWTTLLVAFFVLGLPLGF